MATFKCRTCNLEEGVKNGFCPVDGPVQTTPVDKEAEKIAGVAEAARDRKNEEELAAEAAARNQESIDAGYDLGL